MPGSRGSSFEPLTSSFSPLPSPSSAHPAGPGTPRASTLESPRSFPPSLTTHRTNPMSNLRHRLTPSQEWRDEQARAQNGNPLHDPYYQPAPSPRRQETNYSRPGAAPQQQSYGGQAHGGYSQQDVHNPVDPYAGQSVHDGYYEGDTSQNSNWDARSNYSHTALTMDKVRPPPPLAATELTQVQQDYYPPQPAPPLPYGAPAYPPSLPMHPPHSPYGMPMAQPYYQPPNEYAMQRQKYMNRRSVKQVELVDGHLVLECPVPRSIKQYITYKGEDMSEESGKMRYTAVCDDPDDFTREFLGRCGREGS